MKYLLDFLKKQPLVCGILALIFSMASIMTLDGGSSPIGDFMLRLLLSGTCGVFLFLISEDKAIRDYSETTGYVVKVLSVYWIIAFLFGGLGILALITDPQNVKVYNDWAVRLLVDFFTYFSVGLFEEMLFRAVLNDALIYQFRNTKHIFLLSAVVTSLVFGGVHIFGSVLDGEVNTPITIAQAVLKTVSCGVFGLNLLIMYWKTRNIWACAVVHGGYDFLTCVSDSIVISEQTETGYVNEDSGMTTIIIYSVQTIIELIILAVVWKKAGKKIDFEKIRKEW